MAKLFIGMPIHNGAPFLRQALTGLLEQSYTDFEIFIRDNASTDESQEIIHEFMAKDGRISYERQNVLVPANENFCRVLSKVNAPYFMLAAHDDKHAPTFIEKIITVLDMHEELVGGFSLYNTQNFASGTVETGSIIEMPATGNFYNNFRSFINAPVSSAIYGIYKSSVLDIVKKCFTSPFDWSDVCTIYKIFSVGNFFIYPEVLFTAGITSEVRHHITFKKNFFIFKGQMYEYFPFLCHGIFAILTGSSLTLLEKYDLVKKHIKFILSSFLYFEARSPKWLQFIVRAIAMPWKEWGFRRLSARAVDRLFPVNRVEHNMLPREQWLESILSDFPTGSRILDAGAGELDKKKYCSHLVYVSQDFGQYSGKGDGKGLQTGKWDQSKLDIISDIASIPEPDASFDAILCVEVFEHLPNPFLALQEFSRLCKPGGKLILTAPFCAFTHFAPYFYHTGFSPYWYQTHLHAYGFDIEELTPNGNFSTYLMQEVERIPEVVSRYTNVTPTLFERLGLHLVKSLLSRMIAVDTSSQEFACFGYHVVARKRG